jgi:predicted RecA/RadA family phage recombinase
MGVKLFEKKPVSDHILVTAFPAAKEKGEACVFGSLKGFSDYDTKSGEQGSVNTGKMVSVFQADKSDLTGTAAIAADVYVATDGTLTTTAGSNKLLGTVVAVGPDTIDIAVTG